MKSSKVKASKTESATCPNCEYDKLIISRNVIQSHYIVAVLEHQGEQYIEKGQFIEETGVAGGVTIHCDKCNATWYSKEQFMLGYNDKNKKKKEGKVK